MMPKGTIPSTKAGAILKVAVAPQVPEIIAALLALWEQGQRRQKEFIERRAAAEQAIGDTKGTQDDDPGWEF
jgi:hypothetical protein